ncbi:MAG: A/G-specific adenine glycosylase [Cytophagales bacterium]
MSDFSDNFSAELTNWYLKNKRDLPWRDTKDAYKIWISEVILQQTRVIQGLPYYLKFTELFPNVEALANADEQEVLRCWQGLGYYSRARNMHFTAKMVVEKFYSVFPTSYDDLFSLKGIGPYTAAAVASFASNEDVAVLDGNVMRVLTRLFNIEKDISDEKTKKELQMLANRLLPKGKSAIHNQAMMELGAMICTPQNPKCELCAVNSNCLALENDKVSILPIKTKKIKVKTRYFNYIVLKTKQDYYLMKKRGKNDIWAGLWDFYLIESTKSINEPVGLESDFLKYSDTIFLESTDELKHQLTHQTIWAKFWIFEISNPQNIFFTENEMIALSFNEMKSAPKPILINNFLNSYIFL